MRIRALQRKAPRRSRGQRGQVAVILAFLMIFLILMLGLVTDSVRLFILGTQAIRAAEAGALAGALYMPNYYDNTSVPPSPDGNTAVSRVCAAVLQNGITNCPVALGTVGATPAPVPGNPYEIQVTVTLTANVFFLDFVLPNLSTSTVSRTSVAQFLPPIQLGSRSTYFGDVPDGLQAFWGRLNGPYALKENGDAFTPTWEEGPTDPIKYPDAPSSVYRFNRWTPSVCCTNHQQWPAPIANPDQQPAGFNDKDGTLGYNYEIVVPAGVGNVEVKIYNPAFDPDAISNNNGHDDLGSACNDPNFAGSPCHTDKSKEYLQMHYSLYYAPLTFERSADKLVTLSNGSQEFSLPSLDAIGSDVSAHGCSGATPFWDPEAAICVADPGYVRNNWYTLATITSPGTYRLVVAATGYYGEHEYAIKLTDSSSTTTCMSDCPAADGPRLWAWADECVYFTIPSTSIFDLGEIPAAYAGKTLDFSLYDPGEGSNWMQILDPSGNPVQLPAWVRTVGGSLGTQLDVTGGFYNGLWLHLPITIPANYNPAPGNDWWQIKYNTGSAANDTITISISLSGSPVHLISEVL